MEKQHRPQQKAKKEGLRQWPIDFPHATGENYG